MINNRIFEGLLFVLISIVSISCSSETIENDTNQIDSHILQLKKVSFLVKDNPDILIEDVFGVALSDSVFDCWIKHVVPHKQLVATFDFEGGACFVDGQQVISGETEIDFKKPVVFSVSSGNQTKKYSIYVHAFTGLPTLWINTIDRREITSKEEYVDAKFKLIEDVQTRSAGETYEYEGYIKGRGNATWSIYPKKPYRLKFDSKVSFFDLHKDKAWVLLANYYDKTMLRNYIAYWMGGISKLEWTPKSYFVDLFLNGRYDGTYQLIEKLKIAEHRVNVGDDGFLLEEDGYAKKENDARWFMTKYLNNPINIKDPKVEYNDDNFNYIKNYILSAEDVLYSDGFLNANDGWKEWIDIDSVVEWYLINEILKNTDAMWWSAYFNLRRGGKLKMGPLWDFDSSIGNYLPEGNDCEKPEGFYVKDRAWFIQFFKDPLFVKCVKERFEYFYSHKMELMGVINTYASYLEKSAIENNNRWPILYNYTYGDYYNWGSYLNEVEWMKEWLLARLEWLKAEFDKM